SHDESAHHGTTASSAGPTGPSGSTGLRGSRLAASGSAGPASQADSGPVGSAVRSVHSIHSTHSARAAELAGPASPADLMDMDIAVTEDRRRGIFARLLGRSRTPPVRFLTAHVDPEELAFVLGRAQDRFRATPPLRHAASTLHLNRAYQEQALGNADEQNSPRHDVDDGRSRGPTYTDAQTSPVPTVLTYPSPDHVSVNGSAPPDVTMDQNIPTIPSESSGASFRNCSAFNGRASTGSLTRSTPIPSAFYSPFRGTGLSRPSEPSAIRPAGLLLAPGDPGPSTLGLGRARADNQQPPNAPTDHRNASGAETGSLGASSHGAVASQLPFTDARPASSPDINYRSESNDAAPAVIQVAPSSQANDLTYLSFQISEIDNGLSVELKLSIRVGRKSQLLGDSLGLFSERLRDVCFLCEKHRSKLEQLDLGFHESRIIGGPAAGQDALDTVLLSLTPFLSSVHKVFIIFGADDDTQSRMAATGNSRREIRDALSGLRFLRLEGNTTAARLHTFPLESLRVLELVAEATERDIGAILVQCSKLAVLLAGPVMSSASQNYFLRSRDPNISYPSVMRLHSAYPCEELLADLPSSIDLRFTLTDAHSLPKIQKYFSTDNEWSLIII
ncbi:hypothetical protein K525DRAFT_185403, partial [Schizophyllum commune Loenen D]